MPKNAMGTGCPNAAGFAADPPEDSNDHIIIQSGIAPGGGAAPGEDVVAGGALNTQAIAFGTVGVDKFCGRFLSAAADDVEDRTVCSRVVPFTLGVRFDGFEAVMAAGVDGEAGREAKQETSATAGPTTPLGTTGFSLGFAQIAC